MNHPIISQVYLQEILNYNPLTGDFTWKIRIAKRIRIGDIAGCICNSQGYRIIRINKCNHLAHRLAWLYMYGKYPEQDTDHIDGNKLNNTINNLRDVSRGTNCRNKKQLSNNTSGITGVGWCKARKKYIARLTFNGKIINLGRFDCKYKAASKYHLAKEIYGNFTNRHGQKS